MSILIILSFTLYFVLISIFIILISRIFFKNNQELKKIHEKNKNVISDVLTEFTRRINEAKKSMTKTRLDYINLKNKVEVLETDIININKITLERIEQNNELKTQIQEINQQIKKININKNISEEIENEIQETLIKKSDVPLTETMKQILTSLEEGAKTSKDIQTKTKLSREHISRELKRLYEMNYIGRDVNVRPYIYSKIN